MIDFEEVLEIHQLILTKTSGLSDLRDQGALLAALERPFSGFGETEFYPTPIENLQL